MPMLAFWPVPHPELHGEDIDFLTIERADAQNGAYSTIATIPATDFYGNWVTFYEDEGGLDTHWYKVTYLEEGQAKGSSLPKPAVPPLEVTPKDVINNMQGLPLNAVDAEFIQRWIEWGVETFEAETGMLLSVQTAEKEIHQHKIFRKILGGDSGARIRLRRKPVVEVLEIFYRVRGASSDNKDTLWKGLDPQIEYNTHPDGYNPGVITVYPRSFEVALPEGTLLYESRMRDAINVLFSYRHGFAKWPRQVNELVMRYAAADVMEVAGQAETAGLASHSIDGFSESFTASATTTTLSAMRMYYKKEIQRLSNRWKKPIFG